jgi:Uncharacterised protein family (UPF0175)
MKVTIELPHVIAADLTQKWDDIPRRILEAVAMDGYRRGDLTTFQVGEMLGLRTNAELCEAFQHAGIAMEAGVEGIQREADDEEPAELLRKAQEDGRKAGERIRKAVREMQKAGVLDAAGHRVRTDLPTDMLPDANTTFKH